MHPLSLKYVFALCLTAIVISVTSRADAQQPTAAAKGSRICCNNLPAYAQHLKDTVQGVCKSKPEVGCKATCQAMRAFHKSGKGTLLAQNCGATPVTISYDCPDEKDQGKKKTETVTLAGCYPVKDLLQAYANSFDIALKECGTPETPPPPPPCLDKDDCCPTVLMTRTVEKTAPVEITNYYNNFPAPDPPHVPAESLLDTSFVSIPRPSDTRAAMVDLPFMFDRNGAYGAAGFSISPFRLARAEWSDLKPEADGGILDHIILSAGASRAPGTDMTDTKTSGAGTLSIQMFNDKDLMDNERLRACIQGKAHSLAHPETPGANHALLQEAKSGYWECLKRSLLSSSMNLGSSKDVSRFWWSLEYGYGHHAITPFLGMKQWNDRNVKSNPSQIGVRYTFSAELFSVTADIMSEFVFSREGLVGSWYRQHAGAGMSLAIGNGMTATLGARMVPPSWLEHTNTEFRGIASIGWGGWDIGAMYYQQQFTRFTDDKDAKPMPMPKEKRWRMWPQTIEPWQR
ncbi:MAG: hypothetical protein WC766_03255 [Patescibacteria group bacterium]|jgi:hypothetical protein